MTLLPEHDDEMDELERQMLKAETAEQVAKICAREAELLARKAARP